MPLNLIFADQYGVYSNVVEYKGSDTLVPYGWEWTRNAIRNLSDGIKVMRKHERDWLGTPKLLETLAKENTYLCITQDQEQTPITGGGNGDNIHAVYVTFKKLTCPNGEELNNVKSILINNDILMGKLTPLENRDTATNVAFTLGHGLADYFCFTSHANQYLSHVNTSLFNLAVSLDQVQAIGEDMTSKTMPAFTKHRLGIGEKAPVPSNLALNKELLGDMAGTMLSSDAGFARLVKPRKSWPASPLLEEYLRHPFAREVLYRSEDIHSQTQVVQHDAFLKALFSDNGGMDANDFKKARAFANEALASGKVNTDELRMHIKNVRDTIQMYEPAELLAVNAASAVHRN